MENIKSKLTKSQKEHVTKYFYENKKKFKILNFSNSTNLSKKNLSIDYKIDLIKFRKIFQENDLKKYYSFIKLLELKNCYEKN